MRQAVLKSVAPQLPVPDVVAAAEYYRDRLGFKVLGYWADPPDYAIVARDGVEIHFGRSENGAAPNELTRSGSFDLYIWVTDIDEMFSELQASDADVIEGPIKRIYESTEVVVRDLNGYQIVFAV